MIDGYNGSDPVVVRVRGELPRRSHPEADDRFLVLKGRLNIRLWEKGAKDGNGSVVTLDVGEPLVVPAGVEHAPFAEEEAHVLLIEPTGTPNTGRAETAEPRRVLDARVEGG